MQVIGQDDPAIDMKRHQCPDPCDDVAQQIDVIDQQSTVSIKQIYREEIRGAGHAIASVIGHIVSLDISVKI